MYGNKPFFWFSRKFTFCRITKGKKSPLLETKLKFTGCCCRRMFLQRLFEGETKSVREFHFLPRSVGPERIYQKGPNTLIKVVYLETRHLSRRRIQAGRKEAFVFWACFPENPGQGSVSGELRPAIFKKELLNFVHALYFFFSFLLSSQPFPPFHFFTGK